VALRKTATYVAAVLVGYLVCFGFLLLTFPVYVVAVLAMAAVPSVLAFRGPRENRPLLLGLSTGAVFSAVSLVLMIVTWEPMD